MIELGKYNTLIITRAVDFGLFLRSEDEDEEILIPSRYVPHDYKIGDKIDVFVYNDSEDRRIATTEKPIALAGDFAFLEVVSVNSIGAFLDWGVLKDLFVPFREQKAKMKEGNKYPVYIYVDIDSDRLVASSKLDKFIDNVPVTLNTGEKVNLFVIEKTDLGFKVIINNLHSGIIYENEIFEPINIGDKKTGYIKKVREDEKLDVTLYESGYGKIMPVTEKIITRLKENNDFLPMNDKSSPEEVYEQFQISKKSFKMALGYLYKQKVLVFEKSGIRFIGEGNTL